MVRSLSQETVNEIAGLDRQAEFVIWSPSIHYLDPNVPEGLVSMWSEGDKALPIPVTNGATHFPPGAWILT